MINIIRKLAVVSLLLISASVAMASQWTAAGANQNWTNTANWTTFPNASQQVIFENALFPGGTNQQLLVNNIVNSNFVVAQVHYNGFYILATNNPSAVNAFYTTLIPSGNTLTVGPVGTGSPNVLTAGDNPDGGNYDNSQSFNYSAIVGGGNLVVNQPKGNIYVGLAHNGNLSGSGNFPYCTLDMGGLTNFAATIGKLRVFALVEDESDINNYDVQSFRPSGILILARSNNITATAMTTTYDPSGNGPGVAVGLPNAGTNLIQSSISMTLGQVNYFNTPSFVVGGPISGSVSAQFTANYPNATFTLRGTNGTSPAGLLSVGDSQATLTGFNYFYPGCEFLSFSPPNSTATMDLSLGTADIAVDAMYLGRAMLPNTPQYITPVTFIPQNIAINNGVLTLGKGNVTVTNLYLGLKPAGSTNEHGATGFLKLLNGVTMTVYNNIQTGGQTNGTYFGGFGGGGGDLNAGGTIQVAAGSTLNVNGNLVCGGGANTQNSPIGRATTYILVDASTNSYGGIIPETIGGLQLQAQNGGQLNINGSLNGYAAGTNSYQVGTMIILGSGNVGGAGIVNMTSGGDAYVGQVYGDGYLTNAGTIHILGTNNPVNAGGLAYTNSNIQAAGGYSDGTARTLNLGQNLDLALVKNMTFDVKPDLTVGGNINDLINVSGAVTFPSALQVTINPPLGLAAGTNVLMNYGSSANANQPVLGAFPTRISVSVTNDTVNNQLQLITANLAAATNLYWLPATNTGGNRWFAGTIPSLPFNTWTNTPGTTGSKAADTFGQFDNVVFNDLTGVTATNFLTCGDLYPGSVTFNLTNMALTNMSLSANFTNYDGRVFGAGHMAGAGGMTKNGPGILYITGTNDFLGPVQINGGMIVLGSLGQAAASGFLGNANPPGVPILNTSVVNVASGAAVGMGGFGFNNVQIGKIQSGANPSVNVRKYYIAGNGASVAGALMPGVILGGVTNSGALFTTNQSSGATWNNGGIVLQANSLIYHSTVQAGAAPNGGVMNLVGCAHQVSPTNNFGVNTTPVDMGGFVLTVQGATNYADGLVWPLAYSGTPGTILSTSIVSFANMKFINGTLNVPNGVLQLSDGYVDPTVTMSLGEKAVIRLAGYSAANGATGYVSPGVLNVYSNMMVFRNEGDPYTVPFNCPITFQNGNGVLIVSNAVSGQLSTNSPIAFNGQISGTGASQVNVSLVKGGLGTLTLNAAELFTGGTFINDGGLILGPSFSTVSTNLIFGNGSRSNYLDCSALSAGLTLSGPAAGFQFTPPSKIIGNVTISNKVTMGNGSLTVTNNGNFGVVGSGQVQPGTTFDTGVLQVNGNLTLGGDGSNTNFFLNIAPSYAQGDQINVNGDLNIVPGSSNYFNIDTLGGFAADGTNTLITYTGALTGGGSNCLFSVNPNTRFNVVFVDPYTGPTNKIQVVLTTKPGLLTWKGGNYPNVSSNVFWNVKKTTNWSNITPPASFANDLFFSGDDVVFDDSGSTNLVLMQETLTGPDSMTMSNVTKTYILGGVSTLLSGNITNAGSGTLVVSNWGNINLPGAGLVINSGTVIFKQSTNSTVTGNLGGGASGTLTKDGFTNTLSVNSQSSTNFVGNVNVLAGILRPAAGSVTNTFGGKNQTAGQFTTITVNGGTYDLNSSSADTAHFVVGGTGLISGTTTNGAINNSGTNDIVRAVVDLTLTADTTFGANKPWYITTYDVNHTTPAVINGNGKNLTKVGVGELWVEPGSDLGVSNITVSAGRFIVSRLGTQVGLTNGTITVATNALFGFSYGVQITNKPMVIQAGGGVYIRSGTNDILNPNIGVSYTNRYSGNILMTNGLSTVTNSTTTPVAISSVFTHGTFRATNVVFWTEPNGRQILSGNLSGPGGLELASIGQQGTEGILVLSGSNTYSGGTLLTAGSLQYASSNAFSPNSTNIILYPCVLPSSSGIPRLGVVSNTISPPGVQLTVYCDGTNNSGGAGLFGDGGTWSGAVNLLKTATNAVPTNSSRVDIFYFDAGNNGLTIGGPVNGTNFYGGTFTDTNGLSSNGHLTFTGDSASGTNGAGPALTFNGPIVIGGTVDIGNIGNGVSFGSAPYMTKVYLGATNYWRSMNMPRGMFVIGVDDALPLTPIHTGTLLTGTDRRTIFDLNGHNVKFANLDQQAVPGNPQGGMWMGNSSTNVNATLNYVGSINPADNSVITNEWYAFIVDAMDTNAPIQKQTSLNVSGGALILQPAGPTDPNSDFYGGGVLPPLFSQVPYTGATTVTGGSLDIERNLGPSPVTVSGTGTLRGGGTLGGPLSVINGGTVWPGVDDAMGNPLNVSNNVTFNALGNAYFRVDLDSGLLDQIVNISNVLCAGTIRVTNINSSAFTNGTSLKLFTAQTYASSGVTVLPAAPAPGLVWNSSFLGADGTIRVTNVSLTAPTIARTVSGGGTSLTMSWPEDHGGYRLQVMTNALSIGLHTNTWATVPGSTNVLSVTVPIVSTNPTVFYRLVYP